MIVSEMLGNQKVLPVVVIENEEQAMGLAQALLDGDVNVIEITLGIRTALRRLKSLRRISPRWLYLLERSIWEPK